MSSIPNSAMPHAKPSEPEAEASPTLAARAGKIADVAKANPKTSIAAGAAVIAGVVAAVAIPAVKAARAKSSDEDGAKDSKKKK